MIQTQVEVPARPRGQDFWPAPHAQRGPPAALPSAAAARSIETLGRPAVTESTARTDLDRHRVAMRKHLPALPWPCQAHCTGCDATVKAEFRLDRAEDKVYLHFCCPSCGDYRQHHHDALFVSDARPVRRRRQPKRTFCGSPIQPIVSDLPKTVETLCPECACIILGRYYVKDSAVLIEKTCPEHGYFRDTVNSDVRLYLRAARGVFQDERGVRRPQVLGARHCPSDCGLCNQHLSASCLAQIDLTNRCNLACPVCFADANAPGPTAEPSYEMVVQMLRTLRQQHPYPATAIQFTGGEPTLHPDFHRICAAARDLGFSHIQIATNGLRHADWAFAEQSAAAGLHNLYLQFDGLDDALYRQTRGRPLLETKLACIDNCRKLDIKVVLVPTIIRGFNDHQVGEIFKFAVRNVDVISAISYQPVCFSGRISRAELEAKRYTLGDLAHDLAAASGADLERDFMPLGALTPLSRILESVTGKPKIRASCHSDCAFGTYFFVTPDRRAIPIPRLFDILGLMTAFNEQAAGIQARRPGDAIVQGNGRDLLRVAWSFFRHYRWRHLFETDIKPWTFIRALQGLLDKAKGRGQAEAHSYKTLMAAGMHFMDRYNYDAARVRRCGILYSTPDGVYPFCTINAGPEYRPFIERICAQMRREHGGGNGDGQ